MGKLARLISWSAFSSASVLAPSGLAAGPTSSYLQRTADLHITAPTTVLTKTIEVQEAGTYLFVQSDGRYGPLWGPAASAANMYITVDGVQVTNDSLIDWRQAPNGQQHSYNVIGGTVLTPGAHTVSLMGAPPAGAFYLGAEANLSIITKPASTMITQQLFSDQGPFDFTTFPNDGTSPVPHTPLMSWAWSSPTATDVLAFASVRAFAVGANYGDALFGVYLDGANAGNASSLWTANDLWTGAETQAPLYAHAFFSGLSGTHTLSFDASEFPWGMQGENSVHYGVGAGARFMMLWGGMNVRGKATLSPAVNNVVDYLCLGSNQNWPGCPPVGTPVALADTTINIPNGHNGVVMFVGKTRVQGDSADLGGTASLYLVVDGVRRGSIGVQQLKFPAAVSHRTISASYLAAGADALTPGNHRIQLFGKTEPQDSFIHLAMLKDLPLLWFDGPGHGDAYTASFEVGVADFTVWHNCAANGNWSVERYYTATDNPAPNGGSYALRIRTTGFTPSCSYPGAYALSPAVRAYPGTTYHVANMSRNTNQTGVTTLLFYNAAGTELSSTSANWSSDAWQYNADPIVTATAPAGTATLRVRYGLTQANGVVDLDLLRVY
jgi:hypothetical protein